MKFGTFRGQTGVYIIAEAGVNHNGQAPLAFELIDAAVVAGANAVKFQLFNPEEIASELAPLAEYQKGGSEAVSQIEMLRALTLTHDDYRALARHARDKGIDFIVTPFDAESARFLATLDVPALKIPSGEITNTPFLQEVASLGLPVILSTGTAILEEVEEAVAIFKNKEVELTLLHCTSSYPTPPDQVNMHAMQTLYDRFSVPVGLSDHTEGIVIPIAAAGYGAVIIEKHFTLDRTMDGPDHKASIEPMELTAMVAAIRMVELALGSGEKIRQPAEENTAAVARRSVVLSKDVAAGTPLTKEMLCIKRPGTGIAPKFLPEVVGRTLKKDQPAGTVLTFPDLV